MLVWAYCYNDEILYIHLKNYQTRKQYTFSIGQDFTSKESYWGDNLFVFPQQNTREVNSRISTTYSVGQCITLFDGVVAIVESCSTFRTTVCFLLK